MAEYTTLADLDPADICARYGIGELVSIEAVPGGAANSSFRLRAAKRDPDRPAADAEETDYALTILDNDPTSAPRLASLMGRLENRFQTTVLVRTKGDEPALVVAPDDDANRRVMILKRWVDGNVYPVFPAELLREAGVALARLHRLPAEEVIGDDQLPAKGRRLTAEHRSRIADFTDRAFAHWLTERLDALDGLHSGRQDTLIHGDLYSDNIIVGETGTLVVIDWETACREDPLLDLGMAIIGLGVVDGRLVRERAEAIVDGYSSVLPVTAEERSGVLRGMVELAALIIAYHRYYRHNVRYPGSAAANRYQEMVGIVRDCALHGT
ncbi:phosphotransferase [Nocardia sp. NPDC058658]|uniref:phosphotransferase n=1 Tax=Nocardia sp. NPDC058658 TaxID=3346580 RepID=UPI0036519DF0